MNEDNVTEYFKRTQRDYSYSFKLNVVRQVERGYLGVNAAQRNYGIQGNGTISTWLRKYGSLDWDNKSRSTLPKFPEQKLLELEQKVRLLEKQKERNRQQAATDVVRMVEKVRIRMPRLGTRKLHHMLRDKRKPMGVGRDRLFAIMRANHLQIAPNRQYHVTTNSHHRFRKHKNLIEFFDLHKPEQVWVSDIIYIGTKTNPMYLSLVTDAYSKKIMGFNVSNSLNAASAISAMEQAVKNRKYPKQQLIHHSDRSLQYCCDA